ncbi:beta-ribofuranosylaminobenzene 5'-phosphate synthase family protein [Thermococcus stetteri]|uniref:beta-ribofuranosylaminobenzene 5'-phosphate synthase family protein n=1 Tax=Thermococcus stetteri TaxID=49900 RepID=UPI001AEAD1A1|nr:beta-ribofuranosylaminobenzene 5'-phosphate synthase family protein [Thermococcus stetteri]MBP1912294.1 beta-ribofuranosylaminobenzene 5'-phosphate synthase [Thermococcus stetteri]
MRIHTPRRLHLGLIDPAGSLGRRFGSMGVALEGGYEVRVLPSERLEIKAHGEDVETIEKTIEKMNMTFGTGVNYLVEVRRGIPRHVGLGSTTQLSLSVGTAIARLNGIHIPIEGLAGALGRGKNSGAGIYTFAYGGFVLDGGVKGSVPPLVVREDFPEEWAFLLVIPELKRGPDEEEEKPTMESSFGDVEAAREISHRILLGLLPALKERNIRAFGEHLSTIQKLVGRHFAGFQGGEFREDISLIVEFLNEKTYGAGQSSWGPTVYGLILKSEFQMLSAEVFDYLTDHGIRGKIELGIPRNRGAEIVEENAFLSRIIKNVAGGK